MYQSLSCGWYGFLPIGHCPHSYRTWLWDGTHSKPQKLAKTWLWTTSEIDTFQFLCYSVWICCVDDMDLSPLVTVPTAIMYTPIQRALAIGCGFGMAGIASHRNWLNHGCEPFFHFWDWHISVSILFCIRVCLVDDMDLSPLVTVPKAIKCTPPPIQRALAIGRDFGVPGVHVHVASHRNWLELASEQTV